MKNRILRDSNFTIRGTLLLITFVPLIYLVYVAYNNNETYTVKYAIKVILCSLPTVAQLLISAKSDVFSVLYSRGYITLYSSRNIGIKYVNKKHLPKKKANKLKTKSTDYV